jgi:hypothetical protein
MLRRIFLLAPVCAFALFSCSKSEADMNDKPDTDLATLTKFIVLDPKPQSVEWSVLEGEKGSGLGPTDSALVALLSYPASDYPNVEKSLTESGSASGGLMRKAPKWLPQSVTQSAKNAVGEGFDFGTRALSANPFASPPFSEGFAVAYPSERKVLVYLVTQ